MIAWLDARHGKAFDLSGGSGAALHRAADRGLMPTNGYGGRRCTTAEFRRLASARCAGASRRRAVARHGLSSLRSPLVHALAPVPDLCARRWRTHGQRSGSAGPVRAHAGCSSASCWSRDCSCSARGPALSTSRTLHRCSAHFALDPHSAKQMVDTAPAVYAWSAASGMRAPAATGEGAFESFDSGDWDPVLKEIGRDYLRYLDVNAEAQARGEQLRPAARQYEVPAHAGRALSRRLPRAVSLTAPRRARRTPAQAVQTRLAGNGIADWLLLAKPIASGLDAEFNGHWRGAIRRRAVFRLACSCAVRRGIRRRHRSTSRSASIHQPRSSSSRHDLRPERQATSHLRST